MVPNTSDDLPDPETPVNTVSRRLGISTLTSFRLFSRAPWTRIRSWLSAVCRVEEAFLATIWRRPTDHLVISSSVGGMRAAPPGGIRQREQVQTAEHEQGQWEQGRVGHPGDLLLQSDGDEVGDDGHRKRNGQPAVRLPNP